MLEGLLKGLLGDVLVASLPCAVAGPRDARTACCPRKESYVAAVRVVTRQMHGGADQ